MISFFSQFIIKLKLLTLSLTTFSMIRHLNQSSVFLSMGLMKESILNWNGVKPRAIKHSSKNDHGSLGL